MATTIDQIIDGRPRTTTAKTGFASGGVTCKLGALCFVLSSVQVDSLVLRNPPERKVRKRYGTLLEKKWKASYISTMDLLCINH